LRPNLTSVYAFLTAHTGMHMPARTSSMLAINIAYSESQRHAMPFEGCLRMWMIPPCRCVTLSLMPALLPKSDEFAMNFEGLGTLSS
jgi:hypothetical protein